MRWKIVYEDRTGFRFAEHLQPDAAVARRLFNRLDLTTRCRVLLVGADDAVVDIRSFGT